MEVLAEIAYYILPGVAMVVVLAVSVSRLNFIVKRCGDEGMEVEVKIIKGINN